MLVAELCSLRYVRTSRFADHSPGFAGYVSRLGAGDGLVIENDSMRRRQFSVDNYRHNLVLCIMWEHSPYADVILHAAEYSSPATCRCAEPCLLDVGKANAESLVYRYMTQCLVVRGNARRDQACSLAEFRVRW